MTSGPADAPQTLPAAAPPARVSFGKSSTSLALDALRGAAALAVVADHLRHVFFVEYHELPAHKALFFLPYLVSGCGHQAVIIFFVLSGYLISGSVFRSLQQGRWSWKQYLTHRLVRLWIVLLPALLLGLLFDHLLLLANAHHPVSAQMLLARGLLPTLATHLSPLLLLANALYLQGVTGPTLSTAWVIPNFGSNGALWSLSDEFWYYILFPLGLFALATRSQLKARVARAVGFVLIAAAIGPAMFVLFAVWLLGVLLHRLPTLRMSGRLRWLATVVYACVFLLSAAVKPQLPNGSEVLLSLATLLYLWVLLSGSHEEAPAGPANSAARGMARFSYTLYLVHLPLLNLLACLLAPDAPWLPTVPHLLIAFAVYALLIAFSWLIATATEFRNDQVRGWVERRLGMA